MLIETRQQLIDNLAYANLVKEARLKTGDLKGAQAAQEWFDRLHDALERHDHATGTCRNQSPEQFGVRD